MISYWAGSLTNPWRWGQLDQNMSSYDLLIKKISAAKQHLTHYSLWKSITSKNIYSGVKKKETHVCFTNNYIVLASLLLIAASQGGFTAPQVCEIVGRKNLTIFKGYQCSPFSLMISSSFRKIQTKNLNSNPCSLIFFVLGTTSPAGYRLSKH